MKLAIVCYSFTHNNLVLAGEILSKSGGTLFTIEEKSKRTRFKIFVDVFLNRLPAIKDYIDLNGHFDHYILVSPIWAGKIASPLRSFLTKERRNISSYSFISICGGGEKQQHKIENELTELLGKKPLEVKQLALAELRPDDRANLMNYHVDHDDLQHYDNSIDDFLQKISDNVVADKKDHRSEPALSH